MEKYSKVARSYASENNSHSSGYKEIIGKFFLLLLKPIVSSRSQYCFESEEKFQIVNFKTRSFVEVIQFKSSKAPRCDNVIFILEN